MISDCLLSGMVRGAAEPQLPLDRPKYSLVELQAMHRYCLHYRNLVLRGSTPTKDQDEEFKAFQKVCYGEGVTV